MLNMARLMRCVKSHPRALSLFNIDCSQLIYPKLLHTPGYCAQKLPSSLYINNLDSSKSPTVEVDVDIDAVLHDKDSLHKNIAERGLSIDTGKLTALHDVYKSLNAKKLLMEKEREEIAKATRHIIKELEKTPENEKKKQALITKGKQVKKDLQKLQPEFYTAEENLVTHALKLPAQIDNRTVTDDKVLDIIGQPPDPSLSVKSHVELGAEQGCLHFSPVSPGAYYLLGEWAQLERSIMRKTEQLLSSHNIHLLSGPDFYKHVIIEGSGRELGNPNEAFYLQSKEGGESSEGVDVPLCVEGVGLSVFTGFLMRRVALTADLPIRLASVGPAYLPEYWDCAAERDLCNAQQISAAHVFGAASSYEDTSAIFEDFQKLYKELFTWSGVPVRLLQQGSKHLNISETYRVDYEVWMPSQRNFIQVGSVSQHADFLSRRLMMCHTGRHDNDAHELQYQHTVGGRMVNVTALLAAIVENSQLGTPLPTS